jgi:signal peptidase I
VGLSGPAAPEVTPPEVTSPDAGTPGVPEPAAGMRRRGGRASRRLLEIVETLALTLVIFFAIQAFVAQPFQVQQYSMERTFEQGDYVLVDKLTPRWAPYARGDVIVFNPPPSWTTLKTPYIKRVIGTAGDTVEVRPDGRVYVNGTALVEPYLYRGAAGKPEPTSAAGTSLWVVPPGDLFVMGDHRQKSVDSRVFGPIPISSAIGRGAVRYWPLSAFSVVQAPTYAGVPAP